MSICLCYESAEAAACVHWQGPDRMPLSELHEAAPGNTLSASTQRLPTAGPSLLHERRRKRAIPTLAEPPPLGSDLDRHWRLSIVQKRKNYHKYDLLEISGSHHEEDNYQSLCTTFSPFLCTRQLSKPSCMSTSAGNWALYPKFILNAENTLSLLKAITIHVIKLLMDPESHTSQKMIAHLVWSLIGEALLFIFPFKTCLSDSITWFRIQIYYETRCII